MLQTQAELEHEAYGYGKERMQRAIKQNEEKGRATSNPYAQALFRRFVLPLSEKIKEALGANTPGRHKAHVNLLAGMDPDATAMVAVRSALTHLMKPVDGTSARGVIHEVGRSVYHEYLLDNFSDIAPELFYHLTRDFDSRLSVNERHRMTTYKMQAEKHGIELPVWSKGDVDQVGAYIIEELVNLGMLTIAKVTQVLHGKVRTQMEATLTEGCASLINSISEFVAENSPYFYPCVEPPRPWTSFENGGFHTEEMRRLMPYAVKVHPYARDNLRHADLSQDLACINALQNTRWRVNGRMLDIIRNVSRAMDLDEVLLQADLPKPRPPEWLTPDVESKDLQGPMLKEFKEWKRSLANWHTDKKMRKVKERRFGLAMRVAEKFREYSELYFVYFMDFRGRKYVQTTGISPQGSDLQKSLLEFAEGMPLLDQDAKDWFMISGANLYGVDKVDFPDRIAWVKKNAELIVSCANDPVACDQWTNADKPLQFLAWALEYRDWTLLGDTFRSHFAVGMDGSCNGLQNFSAMLRDEVGGRATNLIPASLPSDIYQNVADVTTDSLRAAVLDFPEREVGMSDSEYERLAQRTVEARRYREMWLAHGITRGLVKRSVMTLPYGSTRSSSTDFILKDYLQAGKAPEFAKNEHLAAARFLSGYVWEAIGKVVVKAREAMKYLQQSTRDILGVGYQTVQWSTPTGFQVTQVYWEESEYQITTKLFGKSRLRVRREENKADRNRHKNGIAPNFVHALDASHLTLTTNACFREGITDFHMVHDDFGVHAANAGKLYRILREQFVLMYESYDPLAMFHLKYPDTQNPPAKGNLKIYDVLRSKFFFA